MERLRLAIGLFRARLFCFYNPAYNVRRYRDKNGKIKIVEAFHAQKAKPSEIFYQHPGPFVAKAE